MAINDCHYSLKSIGKRRAASERMKTQRKSKENKEALWENIYLLNYLATTQKKEKQQRKKSLSTKICFLLIKNHWEKGKKNNCDTDEKDLKKREIKGKTGKQEETTGKTDKCCK